MAYGKSKNLVKRIQSDNFLKDKAFKIAVNPNYDGYQRVLASMVYKFFDKKSKGSSIVTNEPNYQLANELYKPIIRIGLIQIGQKKFLLLIKLKKQFLILMLLMI